MDLIMSATIVFLMISVIGVLALVLFVSCYIVADVRKSVKKSKVIESNCNWHRVSNIDDYRTACGHEFYDASESGDPITDVISFCPYCGCKIELK